MDISLENDKLSESQFFDDWETKKVRFKERDGDVHVEIVMDLVSLPKILLKDMETTFVVKLLGRNIGYTTLFNQASSLWHPSKPFHLMIQTTPWTKFFNPKKSYPNEFLAWIKMLVYRGFMCKKRILEAVGRLVGKVAKLDFNTDNKTRGHFARMIVFVDLDRPLVSQVLETCPSLTTEMSLKTGITNDNLKPSNSTIGGKRS
ncbi:hypothetical protein Goari_010544, partial [Gossypium aridum]|nr:hypothetical protein [Gossypium aridum]